MIYRLYDKNKRGEELAAQGSDDDFRAETWAREWAVSQGSGEDYVIERADGAYTAALFRTVAGQWYIMRQ